MDIFAHALWTLAVFWKYEWRWWAVLLGFLADVIVFGPVFIANLSKGRMQKGPPRIVGFWKEWTRLYNVTHSIPVLAAVGVALYPFVGFWPPLLGWLLHIVVDIPTHSKKFFPTPFLWPFSDYTYDGLPWYERWFMLLNYGALALVWIFLLLR